MTKEQLRESVFTYLLDELVNEYGQQVSVNDLDGLVENLMDDVDKRIEEMLDNL